MSSEHPPEEAELQRPVGYRCLNCDDWGCRRCLPLGGEQSLGVDELREVALRNRVRDLEQRFKEIVEHFNHRRGPFYGPDVGELLTVFFAQGVPR